MKSIKTHLTITLLLCILLPIGLIGAMTAWFFYNNIKESRIAGVGQTAAERHRALRMWLDEHQRHSKRMLDSLIATCQHSDRGINVCVKPMLAQFSLISDVASFSFHSGVESDFALGSDAISFKQFSKPFPPAQIATISVSKVNGASLLSFITIDSTSGFSLITTYSWQTLRAIFVGSPILGQSGETFLADHWGHFITQPRYPAQQESINPISTVPMERCLKGESNQTLDFDYRSVAVIRGFRFVPEIGGGCIMAHVEQREAFSPLLRLVTGFLVASFLLTLLSLLIAKRVAEKLSKPIIALTNMAQALSRGDFTRHIGASKFRELTYLAKRLNSMAGQLYYTISQLKISERELEQKVVARTAELYEQQQMLKENESYQAAIFDATPDAILISDEQGIITKVNTQTGALLGYSSDELLGQPVEILVPERYRATHPARRAQFVANPRNVKMAGKAVCKNGSELDVDISLSPIRTERGLFFASALRDVTERKQAENELMQRTAALVSTQHRLDFLLKYTPAILYIAEAHGDYAVTFTSENVTDSLGWQTQDFLNKPDFWISHLHPDDRDRVLDEFETLLKCNFCVLEYRFQHQNGTWHWIQDDSKLVRDANGQPQEIVGYWVDITERKQTEGALARLQRLHEQILTAVGDGLHGIDLAGNVIFENPAAASMLGWSTKELIGQPAHSTIHHSKADGTRYPQDKCPIYATLHDGLSRRIDNDVFWRKDGTSFLVAYTCMPMRNEIGEIVGTVVAFHDITERKQFEQALIAAKTEAEQANAAKSVFLATMSHEIRTPMNGVIGMIDVLQQSCLQSYQVEMVDIIRDSAFSLLGIIEDILDFSKIEADKLEIDSTPTALAEVVEKVCLMLDHLAIRKAVELTLFTDPAIPETVLSDPQRLRQIIVNLANNAIKFSSGQDRLGRVSVQALLVAQEAEWVVVEISVTDNGIGIDEQIQARLFSPFAQADATTTRRFGGTGLGLSIARKLAQLMGGDITVQSTLGQGSTFTARLPFMLVQDEISATTTPSLVNGLSCLVIGDKEGLANHLTIYLTYAGAVVVQAPDLAAAQAQMAKLPAGLWIWLFDAEKILPVPETLQAISRQNAKLIVIHRGRRRQLRQMNVGHVIELDGNVLTRQSVLQAVAIAAGRLALPENPPTSGKSGVAFTAPSRIDALRHGRLLLIAEDNETNQRVIVQQLAVLGFAADVVDDGLQALERWRSGDYALLLTDLHMPKMDGYELTAAIRAEENHTRHIAIIAITANTLKGEALRCHNVGMDGYLSKPIPLNELKRVLEKWLPNTQTIPQLDAVASVSDVVIEPATQHNSTPKPVDVSVLAALIGDDSEMIHEFLQDFQRSATKIATELQCAFAAGQATQVGMMAHKLKSSARSVGALGLGELCAAMEQAGKAGQLEVIADLLPRFEEEMAAVDNYLNKTWLTL